MHTWVWGSECLGSSTPPILLEAKVSQPWSLRPYLPLFTNLIYDLLGNTLFLSSVFYLSASLRGPFWSLSFIQYLVSPQSPTILLCHLYPFLQNFTNHPGPMSTPQSTLVLLSPLDQCSSPLYLEASFKVILVTPTATKPHLLDSPIPAQATYSSISR